MNETFPIKTGVAQKVWQNFDRELIYKLRPLPKAEQQDIRLEILSHLYDSALNDNADSEEIRLINAIARLGDPDDYLQPLVAEILLMQKAIKGHPLAITKSLFINAQKGLINALLTLLLGIGYFWIVMIFLMAVMHFGDADIGLWFYDSGDFALSFEAQPGAVQWQPKWFSVIGLAVSISGYYLLNTLLSKLLLKSKT